MRSACHAKGTSAQGGGRNAETVKKDTRRVGLTWGELSSEGILEKKEGLFGQGKGQSRVRRSPSPDQKESLRNGRAASSRIHVRGEPGAESFKGLEGNQI